MPNSRLPGFHNLDRAARLIAIADAVGLSGDEVSRFVQASAAEGDLADHLSENVIGVMSVPLGVATNMVVHGQDVLVPMATEESSVIAAVCNGALACRGAGGVSTDADAPLMIAQVQVTGLADPAAAAQAVKAHSDQIKTVCDACDPMLLRLGGGFRAVETSLVADTLIVHLIVDVRDAMGANTVNTMAEKLAPMIET